MLCKVELTIIETQQQDDNFGYSLSYTLKELGGTSGWSTLTLGSLKLI